MTERRPGFFPGRPLIDAYGAGGFRFADMSHRGSLLFLPSGVHAWDVTAPSALTAASLAAVMAEEAGSIELLLLGTGADLVFVPAPVRDTLRNANIRCEPMATGAAARTYNVLLAENRRVAAALIAVA